MRFVFIAHGNLQHLPDFKGIETDKLMACVFDGSCSTSLTSKGLRLGTLTTAQINTSCSTSLTSKGLRRAQFNVERLVFLAAPP